MRWFVEISSIGAASDAPVRLCVEAPQWQPALQKARALRGDEGPLSNFSIELLDEGYRAVDPATRLRYFVRKAPDDAPLTTSLSSAPVVAKPEPLPEDKPGTREDKNKVRGPMETAPFVSTGAAIDRSDGEAAPSGKSVPAKKQTMHGMPAVSATLPSKANVPAIVVPSGIVAHKVHSSREENATTSSPLTYREFVYVVAEGTTEDAAKALLLNRLDTLAKSLSNVQGKLVNMAVFDHAYQGRPQRKPLATLKWRDWRGSPEVVFPSREGQQAKEAQQPAKEAPQPAKEAAARPASTPPPAAKEAAARPASTPPPAAKEAAARPASTPPPAAKPAAAPAVATKSVLPTAKPATSAAPASSTAAKAPAPSVKPSSSSVSKPAPAPRVKTADEVMKGLSDTITDLHFLRDALEGADFILALVYEQFPSEVVLVWFHDADKRELVLVRQIGGKTDQILSRMPDKTGLAQAALRSQRAVVIADATRDARAQEPRWKTMGVEPKSIVVAPVMHSGKPYGLIEILNPKSGGRYGTVENNGLTYLGQQLAEFISNNGTILESDRILEGAKRIVP